MERKAALQTQSDDERYGWAMSKRIRISCAGLTYALIVRKDLAKLLLRYQLNGRERLSHDNL